MYRVKILCAEKNDFFVVQVLSENDFCENDDGNSIYFDPPNSNS